MSAEPTKKRERRMLEPAWTPEEKANYERLKADPRTHPFRLMCARPSIDRLAFNVWIIEESGPEDQP